MAASLPAASRWRPLVVAMGVILALCTALPAQEPEEPPSGVKELTIEGNQISFAVKAAGMTLKDFVVLTQEITQKVIVYTDQDLNIASANITFVGTVKLDRTEFFQFFQTMLYIKGFSCVVRNTGNTEVTELVNMAGQRRQEITSSARYVSEDELKDYAGQTGVQILTTVMLENINAQNASQQTRPFFGTGGGAQVGGGVLTGNLGDNRSILLQGFGPQVYAAYQVLKLADVPPLLPAYETRVVPLQNATAEELEPILKQVLDDRARKMQLPTAGGAPSAATAQANEVQVLAHGSLNTILLSGAPERIVEALDLIARLDRPIESGSSDIHVIQLKNVLADDLQNTLRNFLREDLQAERQQQAQAAAAGSQPRQTVIVAHEESNSLLVSATQTNFKRIENMIDQLDERQPQVLIEAALVELRTTELERLGVEFGLVDTADGDFNRPFGYTSFGLSTFEDTDGDGLPDTRLPDFENPLQGFTGGILSSGDFSIPLLINALQQDERANLLSLPSVVVNNNEAALVKTDENRPTTVVSQGTATTTSGLGDARNAGIDLNISPSISSNDYLRLNIHLVVSRFLTAADPQTGGPILSREIRTQVTLPSAHTMVLGGIIEDGESDAESGIPLLKDIPLLGWLFKSKTSQRDKTNLYFFVTPTILDEDDFSDMHEISQRKKLEAAQYIGHRRLKIVDSKWTGAGGATLEDGSIEDLDRFGGFDIPYYQRPTQTPDLDGQLPTGPRPGERPSETNVDAQPPTSAPEN